MRASSAWAVPFGLYHVHRRDAALEKSPVYLRSSDPVGPARPGNWPPRERGLPLLAPNDWVTFQGVNIQEKWIRVSWPSTYLKFARVSSSPLVPSLFTMMKAAIFALSLAVASAANLRAAAEPKPEVRPRRPPSTPRGGG